ncbi:phage integrase central domain-containing protein [Nocardia asiatica]|uniref:phage integrase central domain-containing protein n=1 Tax=Nocardia asiatica TaxID=209252 RepID=UPI001461679E|nr:hypothetical protein [Nocardia asiatica]
MPPTPRNFLVVESAVAPKGQVNFHVAQLTNTSVRRSALGSLRVWEATTSRIDAHLKRIVLDGHRERARRQRVILSEMMSMAVHHDAIDRNPVREIADLPRKRQKPRAADLETPRRASDPTPGLGGRGAPRWSA